MKRDVVGLRIIATGQSEDPILARIRQQFQAAEALVTIEPDAAEPEAVRAARREAEHLLRQSRYEEARETFLDVIDLGLTDGFFSWHAAVNLVNCHRFLGDLADARATAGELLEMYREQPEHPIHYLLATQLGAIAADEHKLTEAPTAADAAVDWARRAYDWQVTWRGEADGLRGYNLVVALLRVGQVDEARAVFARHEHDDDFTTWRQQGEHAAAIEAMLTP